MNILLGIVFLLVVINLLSFPLNKLVKKALPKWAHFNHNAQWGAIWLDNNKWCKLILIKLFQSIILISVILSRIIKFAIKLVTPQKIKQVF